MLETTPAPVPPVAGYDCDVAIAGGGIVGATLALALQKSGLRVSLIEANPLDVAAGRDRAYAFSLLSQRILKGLGIWEAVAPEFGAYRHICLSDGDDPGVVRFETRDAGETDYLGFSAPHSVLLRALQNAVDSACWLCPATVAATTYDASGATLTVETAAGQQQVRTRVVVAADGARSQTRTRAGIRTRGWKYWQSCVTTTFTHEAASNDTAFERFWPAGPMGVLPLPGDRCQVVWTLPHARARELHATDKATFTRALERHAGGLLGQLQLQSERFVFPVQLMQADRYIQPRLALIGDAAHCCHPVGGQGLNLGIRDAAALAAVLTAAARDGGDIGDVRVLRRYERWRKRENLAILGFTDLLDRTFSTEWLPAVAVRRTALWTLRQLPPARRVALSLMTGLLGRRPPLAR